jgi:hypothetical protein
MYYLVYKEILLAGIAVELEEPVYFDKYNKILDYQTDEAYGCPSRLRITDPSYMLVDDETGSSTNMKKDKTYNEKVIAEHGFQEVRKQYLQTYDIRPWVSHPVMANQ